MIRFLVLLFFLSSCSNAPYRGRDVCGADDFVIDSYQIREGKFAILEMEGKCSSPLCEEFLDEYKDLIHEGDLIQVALYHPTRQDMAASIATIGAQIGYRVTEGKLFLPDNEPIEVRGLSLREAKEKIEESYTKRIHGTEVFLKYADRTMRKVELLGMCALSNIPVDGKVRLFQVLSEAKVASNANFFKSYVVRDDKLLAVDLFKLVKEGDMSQNIVMRGGDKVYIAEPSASSLMVLGEVTKQCVVNLPNGFMTLRQALAEAGGISLLGDKRYIQVIRGSVLCPKIYTLHWEHIARLPSDSLLLIPGDIVYVAATPIAEWNRFVNQILPTIIGLDLIMRGVKNIGVNVP